MGWSDDPLRDFARRDAEEARWLAKRPVCYECEEPISDEECYEFDGNLYCPECLKNHKKWTEDLEDTAD